MKPQITLLIPTRERATRLEKCLETCLEQDWSDCELLISDNVSSDNTAGVIDKFKSRLPIKYINPGKRLGMSEHWEFAITAAQGDYICIIGDDDGLPSWGIGRMKELLTKYPDTEAINWYLSCFYHPDLPDETIAGLFDCVDGDLIQVRRASKLFENFLLGRHGYSELPGIYHKLVKTDLIRRISSQGIDGVAPDIYLSIYLSSQISNCLCIREPLTIAANSSSGNGFSTLSNKGDKIQASNFLSETLVGIAAPFDRLPFKFESNWHLMQLETLVKLKRSGVILPQLEVDYVEHLKQAREEAVGKNPGIERDIDESFWDIYQKLAREGSLASVEREDFLNRISTSTQSTFVWGKGIAPTIRIDNSYPDIAAAMPRLEIALGNARRLVNDSLQSSLPKITDAFRAQNTDRAFLHLSKICSALQSDLFYLASSDGDLETYLGRHFTTGDAAEHAYHIKLTLFALFHYIEVSPRDSRILERNLSTNHYARFKADQEWMFGKQRGDIALIYRHAGDNLRLLDSYGMLFLAPILIKLKTRLAGKKLIN